MAVENTGWLNLTSFASNPSIGTRPWVNPSNAASEDASSATSDFNGNSQQSHYLRALQLSSPGIPSHANIVGIEVRAKCTDNQGIGAPPSTVNAVRLFVAGSPSGDDRKADASFPTGSLAYVTWGGPTELWGLTLIGADVTASNFGWGVSALSNSADGANSGVSVDHMQARIYYDASGMFLVL